MWNKLLLFGGFLVLQQTFQPSLTSPFSSFDASNFLDPVEDSDCKDLRDDCYRIRIKAGKGLEQYCERWKEDEAVSECKKTCGRCKSPSPPACEDERDDCEWILNNAGDDVAGYCEENKEHPAIKDCPKTCGFCQKFPSPPKIPKGTEKPKPKVTDNSQGGQHGQLTWFQKDCLESHNKYRALHGSPPLKWSAELAKDAQSWADKLARESEFHHDPGLKKLGEGENLGWFRFSSPDSPRQCQGPSDEDCVHCSEIVKDWYDEVANYDYNKGDGKSPYDVVTHFTQVVWKASTEMGMSTAVGHKKFISVARYKKPGNRRPGFKENVLRF